MTSFHQGVCGSDCVDKNDSRVYLEFSEQNVRTLRVFLIHLLGGYTVRTDCKGGFYIWRSKCEVIRKYSGVKHVILNLMDMLAILREYTRTTSINTTRFESVLVEQITLVAAVGGVANLCYVHDGSHSEFPIHTAAKLSLPDVVYVLFKNCANLNAVDRDGNTAMHYTTCIETTRLLYRFGASLKKRNKAGRLASDDTQWCMSRRCQAGLSEYIKGITITYNTCFTCGVHSDQKKIFGCAGCVVTRYCSVECQRRDWRRHRPYCDRQISYSDL